MSMSRRDRPMADERSPQVQPPLHRERRTPLDLLRHDLRQQIGLGKVFGADDDTISLRATAQDESHQ